MLISCHTYLLPVYPFIYLLTCLFTCLSTHSDGRRRPNDTRGGTRLSPTFVLQSINILFKSSVAGPDGIMEPDIMKAVEVYLTSGTAESAAEALAQNYVGTAQVCIILYDLLNM